MSIKSYKQLLSSPVIHRVSSENTSGLWGEGFVKKECFKPGMNVQSEHVTWYVISPLQKAGMRTNLYKMPVADNRTQDNDDNSDKWRKTKDERISQESVKS